MTGTNRPPVSPTTDSAPGNRPLVNRVLDRIERLGNRLPDPAALFVIGLVLTWVGSAWLSTYAFDEINPVTGEPVRVVNLMTGVGVARFLENMVKSFTEFPPLGIVLVAMLGVGVAEASGLVQGALRVFLSITPAKLLSPMLLAASVLSHSAADAGFLLVIPLGGVMFHAAGRHPIAGIACAFAGVSGGFGANFLPSAIDPLLAGLTETGVRAIEPDRGVNVLCNLFFSAASSLLVIAVAWFLTDRVVEPRLANLAYVDSQRVAGDTAARRDGDAPSDLAVDDELAELTPRQRIGLWAAVLSVLLGGVALTAWCWPADSPMRAGGSLTSVNPRAPLMGSIVPLFFLFSLVPSILYGYVSGKFQSHRDIVAGMKRSMESMGYYLVLVFFAALFIASFNDSKLSLLLALRGAALLSGLQAGDTVTILGLILISTTVNLFIGSASAKWALLAPVFVPMLMLRGLSPELTQAAYRIGDSATNIVTPMMPYFPLVVVYCQRYVKQAGVGTLGAMMLPYSIAFLVLWPLLLIAYWWLGLPLGLEAPYTYTPPR
jgi:aminobenzoyl-glutamate transport protein